MSNKASISAYLNVCVRLLIIVSIVMIASPIFDHAALAATTYTIDSYLTDRSGVDSITGAQLDTAMRTMRPSNNGLIGLGQIFVDVAREKGLNPLYIAAHAAWESGWGTSAIFIYKNNLFGYGAYDRCPYSCALKFSSKADGVRYGMTYIKRDYLTSNGKYYHGLYLRGMNVHYATDQNWKNGIASIMTSLSSKIPVTSTNLVLKKSAFSSSVQGFGYLATYANDGNIGTRWSSRGTGFQSWYADMGSSQSFNQVVIRWETAYAKKYAIVFSNDRSNWYWRGNYEYISSAGAYTHNLGFTATYRYVGVWMYEGPGNYGNYSMYEMEVYRR
ncbi:MAG: glucosaminidase domain-containing protein [Chloroflexota bacterium]